MKRFALTVLTLALVVAGGAQLLAKDALSDRDTLQGTWRLMSREIGGRARDEDGMRLVFRGDTFQLILHGETKFEGTFKVDPAAKPRRIDMHIEKAAGDESHAEKKTSLGIYEINGDDFRWCAAEPGFETRPTEFAGKGEGCMLAVFKREPAPAK